MLETRSKKSGSWILWGVTNHFPTPLTHLHYGALLFFPFKSHACIPPESLQLSCQSAKLPCRLKQGMGRRMDKAGWMEFGGRKTASFRWTQSKLEAQYKPHRPHTVYIINDDRRELWLSEQHIVSYNRIGKRSTCSFIILHLWAKAKCCCTGIDIWTCLTLSVIRKDVGHSIL